MTKITAMPWSQHELEEFIRRWKSQQGKAKKSSTRRRNSYLAQIFDEWEKLKKSADEEARSRRGC